MIEFRNVSIYKQGRTLLKDATLQFAAGVHTAIIGPNGAGKSTLLKLAAGLWAPTVGNILLDGEPLQAFPRKKNAQRLAYVPQAQALPSHMRVQDYCLLARYAHVRFGMGFQHEDLRVVDSMLELTGCQHLHDRLCGALSGGEQQRVILSAALSQGADWLLLDEPWLNLDPRQRAVCSDIFERIVKTQSVTILEVTHDLPHAHQHFQRILGIKENRIFAFGAPDEWQDANSLFGLFDGYLIGAQ